MTRAEVTRNGFFVAISALALHNKDDVMHVSTTQVATGTKQDEDREDQATMRRCIRGILRKAKCPLSRDELYGQAAGKFLHLDTIKRGGVFGTVVSKMVKAGELFLYEQGMLLSIKKWSDIPEYKKLSRYSTDPKIRRERQRLQARHRSSLSGNWSRRSYQAA